MSLFLEANFFFWFLKFISDTKNQEEGGWVLSGGFNWKLCRKTWQRCLKDGWFLHRGSGVIKIDRFGSSGKTLLQREMEKNGPGVQIIVKIFNLHPKYIRYEKTVIVIKIFNKNFGSFANLRARAFDIDCSRSTIIWPSTLCQAFQFDIIYMLRTCGERTASDIKGNWFNVTTDYSL